MTSETETAREALKTETAREALRTKVAREALREEALIRTRSGAQTHRLAGQEVHLVAADRKDRPETVLSHVAWS